MHKINFEHFWLWVKRRGGLLSTKPLILNFRPPIEKYAGTALIGNYLKLLTINHFFQVQNDEQVKNILSKERLAALNQIKKELPNAPEAERLQEIISKMSDFGPFLLLIRNLDFTARKIDVEGYEANFFSFSIIFSRFLHPLKPIKIGINNQSKFLKGRCLVLFASKEDLIRAFEKNHKFLLNREVRMSIANEAGSFI